MLRLALFFAALAAAAFVTLGGCGTQGGSSTGADGSTSGSDGGAACSPACGSGTVCRGGQCVAAGDGGTTATDGGASQTDGGGSLADGGCVGTKSTGQKQPLDMFIMLDQSGSMKDDKISGGGNKWDEVTTALNSFLSQPGMDGISVGLQFFGLPPSQNCDQYSGTSCTANSDCGTCGPCNIRHGSGTCAGANSQDSDSCDPAVYNSAAVAIAPISQAAAPIASAIQAHADTQTSTPTLPALQGAIQYASAWATAHPEHVVIVVFATDGEPTECDVSLTNIDAAAAAGASATPKILSFVIGVGSSLDNLNGIAQAGGTTSAFIVDTSGNVNTQFLAALNQIRGQAVGCTYLIPSPPSGQQLDYNQVNVQFSNGSAGTTDFVQVSSASACGTRTNAWRYDDPTSPTQIILCPDTCTAVEGAASGTVEVVLGCHTAGPN